MKDFIKKLVETTKKTEEELEQLYKETKEELEKQGIKDDRITKIELGKKLRTLKWIEEHGSATRRKPEQFLGFFLGATRLVDTDEFKRRNAIRAFRDDPTQAQLMGLTDESGTPLDNRPTLKRFGKEIDNPNFHKPLLSHTFTRTAYGIVRKVDGSQPKFFRMKLWRNTAKTFKYKPFVPVQFSAILREEGAGFYELSPHKEMTIRSIDLDIPMEQWIRDTSRIYLLTELDKAHENSKDAIDRWIFTEGDVVRIVEDINPNTGSRSILLSDVDNGFVESVRVFLPADFPLGFREDT